MNKNKNKKVFRSANLQKFFTRELGNNYSLGTNQAQYGDIVIISDSIKEIIAYIKNVFVSQVSQDEKIQVVLLILSYVKNKNIIKNRSNEIIVEPKYLQVLLTRLTESAEVLPVDPVDINLIDLIDLLIFNYNPDQESKLINNLVENLVILSKKSVVSMKENMFIQPPLVPKISEINKTNISKKMKILNKEKQDTLLIKLNDLNDYGLYIIKIYINRYTSLLPILYFLPFVQFINDDSDDSLKKTVLKNIIKKLLNISTQSQYRQYIDEQPNNIDDDKQPNNIENTNETFKIILNEVKASLSSEQLKTFIQSTNNLEKYRGYLTEERNRFATKLQEYKNKLGVVTLNKFNDTTFQDNIGMYMENTIYQQVLNIMKIINPNPTPPAPVITLTGSDKVKVKKGEKYEELGATATDNQDKKLECKITGDVDTSKPGSYTVTYSATDDVGNTSTVTRTVIVFVPPSITLNEDNPFKVKIRDKYEEPGATATDSKGNNLECKITGNVDTSKPGSYTVTYSATDSEGYTSTITRTVTVFVPPSITLNGANLYVIKVGDNYNDPGATATDYKGEKLNVTVDLSNLIIANDGTYKITYSARDDVGNTSTATRTVKVIDFSLYGNPFVDQSNTTPRNVGGTTDEWQSFTPSKNGLLVKIEMYISSPLSFPKQPDPNPVPIVMRLYEGEGTSGVLLAESNGLTSPSGFDKYWVALDNIYIDVTTQKYTIQITTQSSPVGWIYGSHKEYNGGRSSIRGNDLLFKTYMLIRK